MASRNASHFFISLYNITIHTIEYNNHGGFMIIYKIKNKINSKEYIGQTSSTLEKRMYGHKVAPSGASAIHDAIKKYGEDSFLIEEIDRASCQEDLDNLEIHYIQKYNTLAPNGYNLKTGGKNGGSRYSEESLKKMSDAKKGKKIPEEVKKKMSDSHYRAWTYERRKKKSISSINAWTSEEYRKKITEARKKYWSIPDNREKASEAAKKRTTDDLKKDIGQRVKDSFKKQEIKEKIEKHIETQKVKVIDSNGNIYSSIKQAAMENNIPPSSIVKAIKGKYKKAGNLSWRYYETH